MIVSFPRKEIVHHRIDELCLDAVEIGRARVLVGRRLLAGWPAEARRVGSTLHSNPGATIRYPTGTESKIAALLSAKTAPLISLPRRDLRPGAARPSQLTACDTCALLVPGTRP